MRSIHVFDDIQRKDAKEQAKAMRGSDQPLQECITLGRNWAKPGVGLAITRRAYHVARKKRELEKSVELEESA